ncbi:nuclear transport factor 2 family protein [Flavihumibacter fluvii]|uniref:nuclear transport factor 2 family protein n=1 Tax=Flavihumibacter fluvii TaxID=2838157 RepID=UPI001BDF108B|nr:nuclear transport factor 2 family protein [Flavihumibacter fluvii]ULQ53416.1 nuclear transport factor 2 family protein [Flavihumibacter fluvii]
MMKQIVLITGVAYLLGSCKTDAQSLQQPYEQEKFIRQYFELFNQHNWEKLSAMYADTAEFKDPSLGQGIVLQNREEFIKKYAALSQAFPDVKDSVVNIYPSGSNHVVVEFISTGTAPDHSRFELPICTVFTIEKGMITKDFTYYDNFDQ